MSQKEKKAIDAERYNVRMLTQHWLSPSQNGRGGDVIGRKSPSGVCLKDSICTRYGKKIAEYRILAYVLRPYDGLDGFIIIFS
jgi:hypothetical protein